MLFMVFHSKTLAGFILACLIILGSMLISNVSISNFIDSNHWVVHTMDMQSKIDKLSEKFILSQNHMRGYHMTEQEYYLNLHKRSRTEMLQTLESLKILMDSNPSQKVALRHLQDLINEKILRWDNSLEKRKVGGWEAIQKMMVGIETKSRDLKVFEAIDNVRRGENQVFSSLMTRLQEQGNQARWVGILSAILACLLIIFTSWISYRDSRRRELAEENVDRFFTLSLDLLCIGGYDGYFKRLSPSFESVLGYTTEEMYARPVLDFIHPDDILRTKIEVDSQRQGNKVLAFENRFRCKDGGYRTLSWKSVSVGNLMYAVARDVTLQKQYENELVIAREEAQKADIAKSIFLSNMSHEIRTPLNGIVGMGELLSRTPLNSEQKEYLYGIRDSSDLLLTLVNEVLDYSKLESGSEEIEKIDFDLAQLVEDRVSLLGVSAHAKGLKIESRIDRKLPRVLKGDSAKIGQILLNLLNNAIKFTDQGRIVVEVQVRSLSERECKIKVGVYDSGIGINTDQMQRLFKPFMQADSSTARRYGGTGLGLSICKKIVEMMKGEIGVSSLPGKGSLFWFSLAVETSLVKQLPTRERNRAERDSGVTFVDRTYRKNIRILVAEDNQMNQIVIMNMLNILGYRSCTLVENGQDAVNAFTESNYDIVLLDQHMPILDGLEAARRMRLHEEATGKRIPIIAVTATEVHEVYKEQYDKFMNDYLLKPMELDELERTLVKWENRAEPLEEMAQTLCAV